MDIGFFFEYGNRVVQLPVNPDKVTVKQGTNNKTAEVVALGEINRLKNVQLASISFSSFFPYMDWFPAIRTKGDFEGPDFYKDFFAKIQSDAKPARFIITGLNLNMEVSIESFEYYHQAGDHEDAYFTLDLKQYRNYSIAEIPIDPSLKRPSGNNSAPSKPSGGSSTPKQVTIGCDVILNGRVHYTSYGAKPGKTFSNYRGKINFINKKGSHPYHVTTPSGGWLGWVTEGSVQVV